MTSILNLMNDLNSAQKKAVTHPDGPLLVLAGAGSGKTRVVTRRMAWLLEHNISPSAIIALTFTNKAASEMRHRLQAMCPITPWVGTFHSFGLKILRDYGHYLGLRPGFALYDPADVEKVLKQLIQKEALTLTPSNLLQWISWRKNKAMSAQDVLKEESFDEGVEGIEKETLVKLYEQYESALIDYQAVDFDDLLLKPVQLFRSHPHLVSELQARWSHFLIDEYQDTNGCQYQMVKWLAGEKANILAVGDPDQSIYSWRGADIQNILNFEKDFPGATIIKLEENYRSKEPILQAASCLISHNTQRYEKNLISRRGPGEPILLFQAFDDRSESLFVARQVEGLLNQGISSEEIAIFYRTNFQSRSVEDALRKLQIPYQITGGLSFYQRKEIKDILAYLRIILSDVDRIAWERAYGWPKKGIGDKTLRLLLPEGGSCLERLQAACQKEVSGIGPKLRTSLSSFLDWILSLRQRAQEWSIHETLRYIIEEGQFRKILSETDENALERMENLQELISKALEWHSELEKELHGKEAICKFLEDLNLGSEEVIHQSHQIHLMTLHNAKGLEFDYVFIVGLEEMLLPHIHQGDDPSDIEEERRLLYVGMTRARKRLFLSHCQTRFLWGSLRNMRASRFLQELDFSVIQSKQQSWTKQASWGYS